MLVTAASSTTLTVEEDYDYTPYGILAASATPPDHYLFTGKERDTESGLDNFGARYFGSSLGRFMTPDQLNTLALSDPQRLNRYAYADNNPLSKIDVGGRCTAPATSGGQVGICVESYIRTFFLPGIKGKFAFGDNRGPNPHGGTFRTQTLLTVDPSSHGVTIVSKAAGESCAVLGCAQGVNHSELSKISHDDKGNTYFTLTVYGENGYEAEGKLEAPGGWIEMQFSFKVNSQGKVEITVAETKGYPSASIYSYDADGNATDVWQQTESGNIDDLFGPRQNVPISLGQGSQEDMAWQCHSGNPAACD